MITIFFTNLLSSPNLYYNSHYEKFADGTVKCIDDEIPFEIPESWEWSRLGNIFHHTSGKQQSRNNKKGGIPHEFITTSNLYWGYFNLDNVKIMDFTEVEVKSCSATKGDLLVCEGGAGYGRSAIWNKDYDICLQNHIHRLRPVISGVCEYVYHFIYLLKQSNQLIPVGAAMPGLSANRLKNLLIPIPPLNEQKRIAQRIEEIQPLIDKYRIAQEQAEEMDKSLNELLKKSILQYAIQGKLVPQIETEESASALLEKIQQEKLQLVKEGKLKKKDLNNSVIFKGDDNKYFEKKGNDIVYIDDEIPFDIPDSWEWVRFKNLVQFSLGKTPERVDSSYWSPNDFPWVSIADMEDKTTLTKTKEFISQKALTEKFNNTFSPIGTLIMSFKLTIGKVSILGINAVHNEAIISIFPFINEDNITRDYLYNFLSIITRYTASTDAIKGATLNSKKISEMLVPLPPLQEQKRIVEALDNVLASIMRN